MWYLFTEIWIWLLASFALGWVAHWLLCCRGDERESAADEPNTGQNNDAITGLVETGAVSPPAVSESWKPQGFASQPDKVNDLKRIKGVGSVIEETLNGLGVYQFEQIAKWDDNNVSWIENFLAFPGRIERETWIEQAKTLDNGGTTEFAKRVDKGDVDYSG